MAIQIGVCEEGKVCIDIRVYPIHRRGGARDALSLTELVI